MVKPEHIPEIVIDKLMTELVDGRCSNEAALAKALNAWPGMQVDSDDPDYPSAATLLLPLEEQ
jgi:hypothetical protein